MTTYAYHHESNTIAVDSRICRHDIIQSDEYSKVHEVDGKTFILCGIAEDAQMFIDIYLGKYTGDLVPEAYGLVIDNEVAYSVCTNSEGVIQKLKCTFNESGGSGEKLALAAMDYGCGAEDAVKYAMTRDIYTGGKVKVIKVK